MTTADFLRRTNSPWRMALFLLWKLPSAWFMGIRVRACDGDKAVVSLPYSWRAQNPFRSTYFAAQCAAGELSTGILAMAVLQEMPPFSMLVTHIEADFFKKADQTLLFTCEDGPAMRALIQSCLADGVSRTFRAQSIGRLPDGVEAVRVWITWSFKARKPKSA